MSRRPSALRQIRIRILLPGFRHRTQALHTAKAAIPILPSSGLNRTTAFYARAGSADAERHDGYMASTAASTLSA